MCLDFTAPRSDCPMRLDDTTILTAESGLAGESVNTWESFLEGGVFKILASGHMRQGPSSAACRASVTCATMITLARS